MLMAIIKVQNVSKKFCRSHRLSLRYGIKDFAKKLLRIGHQTTALRRREFWAVDDVSFSLEKGESIGLIGVNGSGKTTLLKMISGVLQPDIGSIEVNGRIVPLFAKGAGFDMVLNGYENIQINLSLLGLNREEIERVRDEVISFSELTSEALSAPVKTYSSGMVARLGFSCAINSFPDVLIIDEALAVGDIKFRTKCYRKLSELKKSGTTLVLVSHSLNAVISNCEKAIFMKSGKLISFGESREIGRLYEADLGEAKLEKSTKFPEVDLTAKSEAQIESIDVVGQEGAGVLTTGEPLKSELKSLQSMYSMIFEFVLL